MVHTTRLRIISALIIMLLIAVSAYLVWAPFPKKVDMVRPVVSYYGDNASSLKHTSMKVSGTLYRPLFHQHKFQGKITIEELEFTKTDGMVDLFVLTRHNGINNGNLVYHTQGKPWDFTQGGMIWFDDRFEKVHIVGRWGDNPQAELFITSAESYMEATQLQNEMKRQYGSGFVP